MRTKLLPLFVGQAAALAFLIVCPAKAQTELQQNRDARLQRSLERTVWDLGLGEPMHDRRLAVALVDITEPKRPRYAAVNDTVMMYAASLPKIAIVLAGFERIAAGLMDYTPAVREMFTRLVRFSSNTDASRAIHKIGFSYIAHVLTSTTYRLYDPLLNGGLWLGKAYGGPNDYWKRDPLHNISHGATALQVARFFLLLEQGKLVSPEYSAEIKEILSKPGIQHKFVKGLSSIGVTDVYRKSGTWKDAHCDAALVEHDGHKYIAVALMKDERGGEVLPRLIQSLDRLIVAGAASNGSIWSAGGEE
jgi:beta-lactamase class A